MGLKGAAKGAGTGALAGVAGGGWGAPIGAGIGFLTGGLFGGDKGGKSGLGATNDNLRKVPTGTPEQEAAHNRTLAQSMGMAEEGGGYNLSQDYYNKLLGPDRQQALDEFSDPYIRQFQEQITPRIAERFAGAGALSSSGFGQALGGASSDLQSRLAQMFSQLQSQAAEAQTHQYNQLNQTGLNYEPFAYVKEEGSKGGLGSFFEGLKAILSNWKGSQRES